MARPTNHIRVEQTYPLAIDPEEAGDPLNRNFSQRLKMRCENSFFYSEFLQPDK